MRSFKSVFGVLSALLPIVYCAGLLVYFSDLSGETGPTEMGLSPTMIGLAGIGLLFCIPLLLKVVRLAVRTRPGGSGPEAPLAEAESAFDADAALARYMARRSADPHAPPLSPLARAEGVAPRPSFGRKIG